MRAEAPTLRLGDVAATPPVGAWLSERERAVAATLALPARRAPWLAGRWQAKRLAAERWPERALPDARVEVLAAADGAPELWLDGERAGLTLSVSHRAGRVVVALADGPLGVDLEHVEPRSAAFVADYLTPAEQRWVGAHAAPELAANLVWSAKEAALKALRSGLRRDTRTVEVTVDDAALRVHDHVTGADYLGAWRRDDALVLTWVRAAAPDALTRWA